MYGGVLPHDQSGDTGGAGGGDGFSGDSGGAAPTQSSTQKTASHLIRLGRTACAVDYA